MLELVECWLAQRDEPEDGNGHNDVWLLEAIDEGVPLSTIEFGPCDVAAAWVWSIRTQQEMRKINPDWSNGSWTNG